MKRGPVDPEGMRALIYWFFVTWIWFQNCLFLKLLISNEFSTQRCITSKTSNFPYLTEWWRNRGARGATGLQMDQRNISDLGLVTKYWPVSNFLSIDVPHVQTWKTSIFPHFVALWRNRGVLVGGQMSPKWVKERFLTYLLLRLLISIWFPIQRYITC